MAFQGKQVWIVPLAMCLAVAVLWGFPKFWYTKSGDERKVWFTEREQVEGWAYTGQPVDESAERLLVADRTFNGEFRKGGQAIRVFSAKRFEEKANEIGLFVHTPDRCWVEGGWKIEPIAPAVVEVNVHGVKLLMERRLFEFRGERELVYFCGLVGGQALPYRLDHNLSVAMRTALKENMVAASTAARVSDTHFWKRLGTTFASRRPLLGPKQFIRISTPIHGQGDLEAGDGRLREFIAKWLVPGDYERERSAVKAVASR